MKKETNEMASQYFWVGTEAELIKVFPVIIECQRRGEICHIIATGQNDIKKSRIMSEIKLNGKFIELSQENDIKKTTSGLLKWFLNVKKKAPTIIKEYFDEEDIKNQNIIVHGDTVSTYMGALVGKKLRMRVCHVEAGLRSHHLFNPFPEEIDRLLTSRIARVHFAPGDEPVENLKKSKGIVVNTKQNTLIDSLDYSKKIELIDEQVGNVLSKNYFVFVMHRQENLMDKGFFRDVLTEIKKLSKNHMCVFLIHKITKVTLEDIDEYNNLEQDSHFMLLPRTDYFDFMKLLNGAEFVITDGGSNQEELHYMGKPCLIMRKTTERQEGIGMNAKLFGGDIAEISEFGNDYMNLVKKPQTGTDLPSKIIVDYLTQATINK